MGVCVEGGNSTDVTLSAHIPNTNFCLHTSRYSNNHRKTTRSRFWSMCYLKTSPKLPPHISVPTGMYWRWERVAHPQAPPTLDYEQEQQHTAGLLVGVLQCFWHCFMHMRCQQRKTVPFPYGNARSRGVTLLPNSPQGLSIPILLLSYSPFGQDWYKRGRKGRWIEEVIFCLQRPEGSETLSWGFTAAMPCSPAHPDSTYGWQSGRQRWYITGGWRKGDDESRE